MRISLKNFFRESIDKLESLYYNKTIKRKEIFEMKVYVVLGIIEEEYCGTEIQGIFSTKVKAEKYVEKNQWQWQYWGDNDDEYRDALSIEEWEIS